MGTILFVIGYVLIEYNQIYTLGFIILVLGGIFAIWGIASKKGEEKMDENNIIETEENAI